MKKFISLLLAAALLLSMTACGASSAPEATAAAATQPAAAPADTAEAAPTEAPATEPAPAEPEAQDVLMSPEMIRYYLDVPATGSIRSGEAITPLDVSRALPNVQAQDGIQPYSEWKKVLR